MARTSSCVAAGWGEKRGDEMSEPPITFGSSGGLVWPLRGVDGGSAGGGDGRRGGRPGTSSFGGGNPEP